MIECALLLFSLLCGLTCYVGQCILRFSFCGLNVFCSLTCSAVCNFMWFNVFSGLVCTVLYSFLLSTVPCVSLCAVYCVMVFIVFCAAGALYVPFFMVSSFNFILY